MSIWKQWDPILPNTWLPAEQLHPAICLLDAKELGVDPARCVGRMPSILDPQTQYWAIWKATWGNCLPSSWKLRQATAAEEDAVPEGLTGERGNCAGVWSSRTATSGCALRALPA